MTDEVRRWAASMAKHNPAWSRPAGALNQCEVASFRFSMWLRENGIESERVTRARPPHVAVYVDGLVVDLTMRQFDAQARYPWIGTYGEWHRALDGPNPD